MYLNRQNATGATRLRQKGRKKKQYAHIVRIVAFGGALAHGVLAVQNTSPRLSKARIEGFYYIG